MSVLHNHINDETSNSDGLEGSDHKVSDIIPELLRGPWHLIHSYAETSHLYLISVEWRFIGQDYVLFKRYNKKKDHADRNRLSESK